jgi:RNA polymerase sigma factor (sigma-70 family)
LVPEKQPAGDQPPARTGSEGAGPTDDELVLRCAAGDENAWKELVGRYERLVFSVALREGLTTEDAADVTQIVFEAFLQSVRRARSAESLAAWLVTVTRRQSWRIRERSSRESLVDSAAQARELARLPVDDRTAEIDRAAWLYRGLQQLSEPCRSLLMALYFDPSEPSYADVAVRLGRPLGSIGPTRARCLERLREILGGTA